MLEGVCSTLWREGAGHPWTLKGAGPFRWEGQAAACCLPRMLRIVA